MKNVEGCSRIQRSIGTTGIGNEEERKKGEQADERREVRSGGGVAKNIDAKVRKER